MADDANRVVVSIEAQTQQLEQGARRADQVFSQSMSDIERSASQAERQIVSSSSSSARALQQVHEGSGLARIGMQQLGYQLGDISQGFATGTSAATIFAQQSGQVIQALQLMSTETNGVLALLGGPWGAVLSAALVAATPFVAKIFEGNDGLTDQVQKLQENAAKQAIAAEANRIFAGTQAGLDQRIRDTTTAIEQQNASLRTNAELQNINAKAEYAAAQKKLADAQTAVQAANKRVAQLSTPGATDPRLAGAKQDARDSLASAQQAAQLAQDSVREATQAVINSRVALASEQAAADAAASTRTGKITKEYDDQIKAIKLRAAASAQAGKDMSAAEYVLIKDLEIKKQAALKAAEAEGGSTTSLLDAKARLAAADTATQRASAQLSLTRAEARAELKAGTITEAEYTARIRDAEAAVNGARASTRAHSAALREQAKAAAEAARLVRDASTGAYKAVADLQKDQHKELMDSFKEDAKGWDDTAKSAATAFKAGQDQRFYDEDQLQKVREENVRTTANLYYDLFTGGTHRLWQDFERLGLQIISKLLAEWTINSFAPTSQGGQGGGIGGLIGSIAGALGFGGGSLASASTGGFDVGSIDTGIQFSGFRASGGPVQGGRLYRVNEGATGMPEGFVPQGSGNIIPLGRMKAAMPAAGGTIVHQYFTLDARYGITTSELLRGVSAAIQNEAGKAGATAYQKALTDAPGALRKNQQFVG